MVEPFQLARLPKIIFGSGTLGSLAGLIRRQGGEAFILTGARSFVRSPQCGELFDKLNKNGLTFHHVTVSGEPSPGTVDEIVARFAGRAIGSVVGIGGGSVTDTGKAVSAMLKAEGSVKDYLEVVGTKEHPGDKVPYIAVPTTSGTGSEATKNAVLSQVGSDGFKRSLRHDNFVPDVAIVDPSLTLNCPPYITAAAGMDCFTQLTEAYLSVKAGVMTDALAIDGLKAVSRSLVKSYTDGDDIRSRSDMSYAALMSGICLANAGLGTVHGLAGTIGALTGISHGVACGTLMAETNACNVRELRQTGMNRAALGKYATLGRIFADTGNKPEEYYIDFFIDYLRALTYSLKLPGLGSLGMTADSIREIVSQSDNKNNPVPLSGDQMSEILLSRM